MLEPATGEPYGRDPRGIAKKAEAYLKSTGIGDTVYLRPGGRVLRLRRRALHGRPLQHRLQARLHRAADQRRHRLRGRQSRPPHRRPRAATSRSRRSTRAQDMRGEMLAAMAAMGVKVEKHHHEVASAQHELGMKFDTLVPHGRPHADLQVLHPQRRPQLRQDRDLHAEADLWRQRLGHARAPVDLEGRQAALRRQQVCRPVARSASSTSAASSSTPRRSTPSPTRRPTPTSAWSRATRRRCCSPIRPATARPPAASRTTTSPKAKRVEVRFPDPAREPLPRLRRDADGRPRRHQEQDRSRRRRWTRTSTTCRRAS